jgi:hypothetical protein
MPKVRSIQHSDGVATLPPTAFTGINSVSNANYTITDSDGYDVISVTTGSSDRTITLPSAANNAGRRIRIVKSDSGTGDVLISGTINGGTSNNYILSLWGYCEVISDGSGWRWAIDVQENGSFTPVATYASGSATHSLQTGKYSRSGRRVFYQIDIAFRIGTGSGTFTIAGLPYTSNTSNAATAIGYLDNVLIASGSVLYAHVVTTSISFYTKAHSGSATAMSTASATQFVTAGSDMRVTLSGSYEIGQ